VPAIPNSLQYEDAVASNLDQRGVRRIFRCSGRHFKDENTLSARWVPELAELLQHSPQTRGEQKIQGPEAIPEDTRHVQNPNIVRSVVNPF
jgi:hypothetical protein